MNSSPGAGRPAPALRNSGGARPDGTRLSAGTGAARNSAPRAVSAILADSRRRQAVTNRRRSSSLPPQPMMMALTTSSFGRTSACIAACIVECTTRCPAWVAILRQDGSPDQVLYPHSAPMNCRGVVTASGSGLKSNPMASLIWPASGQLGVSPRDNRCRPEGSVTWLAAMICSSSLQPLYDGWVLQYSGAPQPAAQSRYRCDDGRCFGLEISLVVLAAGSAASPLAAHRAHSRSPAACWVHAGSRARIPPSAPPSASGTPSLGARQNAAR